jgi:hypothetical protein
MNKADTGVGGSFGTLRAMTILMGALALPAFAAVPAAAQVTAQVTMHSETGDWVGQGQEYNYDTTGAVFTAQAQDRTGDGVADYVTIHLHTPDWSHWWYLTFATNQLGTNLAPGFYGGAQRAAFASPGCPGLDVSGDGRGSNTLTGSFRVEEAVFDTSGGTPRVVRFAASFEQHSEGMPPALFGTVRFVDSTDRTPPATTASFSGPAGSSGWYRGAVQVSLAATDDNEVAATWYAVDGGAPQRYTAPFPVSADGSHTLSFWSVDTAGNQEPRRSQSFKIDATAPAVSVSAAVNVIRTQGGNAAVTTVSGHITDAPSGVDPATATYQVTDEYGLSQPSDAVTLQGDGLYSFTLVLEGPRSHDKDGRTYWITVNGVDRAGNPGSRSVPVIVPRR